MSYTDKVLSIVCPKCRGAVGGKCLSKTLWGSAYIQEPHTERVLEAERLESEKENNPS